MKVSDSELRTMRSVLGETVTYEGNTYVVVGVSSMLANTTIVPKGTIVLIQRGTADTRLNVPLSEVRIIKVIKAFAYKNDLGDIIWHPWELFTESSGLVRCPEFDMEKEL
jgi:hypothetical protein